ncbi:HAD family hydrolase [Formosa algae]|jgi:Cof subfamily protein (haloacid dehalogenase superfamily)|uniref:Cof subfamily protein (Haloacid dehalogenase superfamily) n=1 Tax=Formosa algae TaxID=225843 RepID=A0A9X0YMH8_9FLAO|nr:HAD family hydrolase [Formosa algae]MBP1841359.1 Cof subfamily protein (haloacid dehalogenase superfamily) [Formosa algae]MDQ0336719.1 Cof subfamily protein (haloacid dehalogenase superfamily) [Formosa algae]OEI78799.1 haloacid dehalogenase [Formosa algae]PNW25935.1 haloacid dehalogenase [Formosa algae]
MELSQVKLVVTDMDGTLLNSKGEVSPQFYTLFRQLQDHNIQFIAASGRQYFSIIEKLDAIKDEITIIAENGGITKRGDQELAKMTLSKDKINSILPLLRTIEDTFIVLCGKTKAYIETDNIHFPKLLSEYYTEFNTVDDLTKVTDDEFLKLAIYHIEDSEANIYPKIKHLEDEFKIKVSGQNWLDISHHDANKGFALKLVQDEFGISEDETMVFGDYNNDLEMLERAYFSYAMANAHPNVKHTARFETSSNDALGVETVLEQLIAAKAAK